MNDKFPWIPMTVMFIVSWIGFGLMVWFCINLDLAYQRDKTMWQESGKTACESGLPASVNPYKGARGREWLEGYIEAKSN